MVTSAMFVLAVGCSATLSELPGDVWRFDNVEELPKHMAVNAPRYAQHRGDKCVYLSEIIDGRRLDYVCYDNDEVRQIGEQTSLLSIKPTRYTQTITFGVNDLTSSTIIDFEAYGNYGDANMIEQGTFASTAPKPCRVVMGNDTVRALVSTERRQFVAKMDRSPIATPLNANLDSLETYTITHKCRRV